MKQKITETLAKLTAREKLLAAVGSLVLLFIFADSFLEPIITAYKTQKEELKNVKQQALAVPYQLETYLRLHQRKEIIEKKYKEVSFNENIFTHIENLIQNKAKIEKKDFKINDLNEKPFGDSYVQEPFRIELFITSIADLTSFLETLVRGERPLVLTRIQIKKAPNRTRLIVQLDVSNFREISA